MCDTNFTFGSGAHDTVSWLDHIVSTFSMREIIPEMDVLHNYRQISNIRRTQSPNLNVPRLVSQLSLPNPLKPVVKSRMKM